LPAHPKLNSEGGNGTDRLPRFPRQIERSGGVGRKRGVGKMPRRVAKRSTTGVPPPNFVPVKLARRLNHFYLIDFSKQKQPRFELLLFNFGALF